MKTRKRIATVVAFLFLMVGLVAIAPSAQAGDLAEGVHRVQRSCTGTMGNNLPFQGTISATFKIDFLGHDPAPGARDRYNFTLLDALYTGTAYRAGAYPTIDITAGSGGPGALYLAAQNGGQPVYNQPFGDNWPVPAEQIGPITLRTLGTAPAVAPNWVPWGIATPDGAGNNWMRINFGDDKMKNNCVFFIDLGLLNEPVATPFGNANFQDCAERIEDQPAASLTGANANLAYKLAKNPTSNVYSLTDLVFSLTESKPVYSGPSTPYQWYDQHHLTLHSGDGLVSYLDPTGGIEYPDVQTGSTQEFHWPDPSGFPSPRPAPHSATFDWTEGDSPPYIEWEANNTQNVADQCSQRWYLGVEHDSTGLDPDLNWENQTQFAFNDCNGGFGTVELNATWATDFNEQYDHIKTLLVNNSSTNRITIERYLTPGSTALTNRSPQMKTLTPDRVYTSMGGSDAERIVNPLSSRAVNVSTTGNWNVSYGAYSTPTSIRALSVQDYAVKVTLRAWIPNPANLTQWIPCTAADVDLRNLQLQANAAP